MELWTRQVSDGLAKLEAVIHHTFSLVVRRFPAPPEYDLATVRRERGDWRRAAASRRIAHRTEMIRLTLSHSNPGGCLYHCAVFGTARVALVRGRVVCCLLARRGERAVLSGGQRV